MTLTRAEADVLRDLAEHCWWAKRMTIVDPDYAAVHEALNDLLTELGL